MWRQGGIQPEAASANWISAKARLPTAPPGLENAATSNAKEPPTISAGPTAPPREKIATATRS
jgi:hypothetical protein